MLIIFPSEYFDVTKIDPVYQNEYDAVCKIPEFKTVLFNYDGFAAGENIKIYPKDFYTGDCIYRGWMLNPEQYKALYDFLRDKRIHLITTPDQYDACHLFPAVYNLIKQHTPKTLIYKDGDPIDWELVNLTFKRFMVKDYVKSVKGANFPAFFETPVSPAEMDKHIEEFIGLRSKLYTGGIVLKEYVDLRKYGEHTNEYRAFYLKNQLLSLSRNSNQAEDCPCVPSHFVDKFKNLPSSYYTVDFAELADGSWVVIETGDGQVSGLSPGQWEFKFYDDMRAILQGGAE